MEEGRFIPANPPLFLGREIVDYFNSKRSIIDFTDLVNLVGKISGVACLQDYLGN